MIVHTRPFGAPSPIVERAKSQHILVSKCIEIINQFMYQQIKNENNYENIHNKSHPVALSETGEGGL